MHGRLKVKSSEQQEAERKAERAAKCAAYQKAMGNILDRRESGGGGDDDDQAQLKMTAGVLLGNADITVLWNIRKEVILRMEASAGVAEMKAHFKGELSLTKQCLVTNPKSYGAWYHRCWCLRRMSDPDWATEINLCNGYLDKDERNFHCWDYRRFVVDSAGVPDADELRYTFDRINENFSNYSAWHYRSKLLPLVHPAEAEAGSEGGVGVAQDKRRLELEELVQHAAVTDPDDSSAQFYHTWMLGLVEHGGGTAKSEILGCKLTGGEIVVIISVPVHAEELVVDGVESWFTIHNEPSSSRHEKLWIGYVNEATKEIVLRLNGLSLKVVAGEPFLAPPLRQRKPDEKMMTVLENDLRNWCELHELEPDSKWINLSRILVMRAMDRKANCSDVIKSLETIQKSDTCRKHYFADLRSKFIIENYLDTVSDTAIPVGTVDLSNRDLTCLHYRERLAFAEVLDLSGNNLSTVAALLPYLRSCRKLILASNCLLEAPETAFGRMEIIL